MASLIGLGLGVLAAVGLEALLKGFGISLPSGSLVFEARTVIAAIVVGLGVTVVSAISPARRAVRIPPVAALVDYQGEQGESSRRRIVIGTIIAVLGIAALGPRADQAGDPTRRARRRRRLHRHRHAGADRGPPHGERLGTPVGRASFTISGKLGRENSMRSPRRTAQTASALMVGLALVSTITVFGASLSKSATSSVDNAVSAEYIVTATGHGRGGFSNSVATAAARVPGVATTSTVYSGRVRVPELGVGRDGGLGASTGRHHHPAHGFGNRGRGPRAPTSC